MGRYILHLMGQIYMQFNRVPGKGGEGGVLDGLRCGAWLSGDLQRWRKAARVVKPALRFRIDLSECYARHRFAGFTTFTGFFLAAGAVHFFLDLNEKNHASCEDKRI